MAYDDIEDSVDNGEPLFFYEFIYDVAPGAAYRYVADTQRRVVGGKVWQPFAIKHDEITVSGSLDKQTLTVTARNDIAITALYIAGSPSREVQVNIWRGHADTADIVMEWTGRLLNCTWKGPDIEMSCESLSTALTAIGLRRKYQRGCPHTLYGKACRAPRLAHTENGTVATVNNRLDVNVTLSGAETGFTAARLIGGVFRVTVDSGITEIRAITSATLIGGRQWRLTLMSQIPEIRTGLAVSVSKGCPHTFDACRDTFQNAANYGGCANIPEKNPFTDNQF